MTTMEHVRRLRAELPQGHKDPWGQCCPSKRVLLHRALKKECVSDLTDGELTVFNEFLEHVKAEQKSNKEYEKKVKRLAKQ